MNLANFDYFKFLTLVGIHWRVQYQTLGELKNLVILILSHNSLFGSTPSSFAGLSVSIIDISYNQLEGALPNSPIFENIPLEKLENNKGLCCGEIIGLVSCDALKIIRDKN